MNALQPSKPFLKSVPSAESSRRPPRSAQRSRRHPYRVLTIETTAKLGINLLLALAGVSAMARILPYQLSQQERLQEIRTEVKQAETRVNRLRVDFSRSFDPQQIRTNMQIQSHRVDPKQRQIIWLDRQAESSQQDADPVLPD